MRATDESLAALGTGAERFDSPASLRSLHGPVLAAIAALRDETLPSPAAALPTPVVDASAPSASAAPEAPVVPIPVAASARPRGASGSQWIGTALRAVAHDDPALAGRLIVGLLPLQGDVIDHEIDYDLVIDSVGTCGVTVTPETTAIRTSARPRGLLEVEGRIETTLSGLGTLPCERSLRTALRSGAFRVRGKHGKRALGALRQLAGGPLSFEQLRAGEAALDCELLLALVAAGVGPQWTIGHRFTICVEGSDPAGSGPPAYLRVDDGRPVAAGGGPPLEIPSATLRCSVGELAGILLGEGAREDGAALAGDRRPLVLLQRWVRRLEAGRR